MLTVAAPATPRTPPPPNVSWDDCTLGLRCLDHLSGRHRVLGWRHELGEQRGKRLADPLGVVVVVERALEPCGGGPQLLNGDDRVLDLDGCGHPGGVGSETPREVVGAVAPEREEGVRVVHPGLDEHRAECLDVERAEQGLGDALVLGLGEADRVLTDQAQGGGLGGEEFGVLLRV